MTAQDWSRPPTLGESLGQTYPAPSGECRPAHALVLGFWPPDCETLSFCCLNPLECSAASVSVGGGLGAWWEAPSQETRALGQR